MPVSSEFLHGWFAIPGSFYHDVENEFVQRPVLENPQGLDALFVVEAKLRDVSVTTHVPQAIMEMFVCAKHLG